VGDAPGVTDRPPPQRIHWGQIRRWKPGQNDPTVAPKYESIVRLGPMRWGMTVRQPNGERTIHELGRVWLDTH
jgi:hypothetical protein